jgi:hypothetical protein
MHAALWKLEGDPDDLLCRYDALIAETPTSGFTAHLCLRAPDGIVIFDTCPTRQAFEQFAASEDFAAARRRHGLPDPARIDDYPVHVAFLDGAGGDG